MFTLKDTQTHRGNPKKSQCWENQKVSLSFYYSVLQSPTPKKSTKEILLLFSSCSLLQQYLPAFFHTTQIKSTSLREIIGRNRISQPVGSLMLPWNKQSLTFSPGHLTQPDSCEHQPPAMMTFTAYHDQILQLTGEKPQSAFYLLTSFLASSSYSNLQYNLLSALPGKTIEWSPPPIPSLFLK